MLVGTYPQYIVVPDIVAVQSLVQSRMDGRIPAASYLHSNGCAILVSSMTADNSDFDADASFVSALASRLYASILESNLKQDNLFL